MQFIRGDSQVQKHLGGDLDNAAAAVADPSGQALGELHEGERLDGSNVVSYERITYLEAATYDLMPAGETGFYWAGGVLLGSTLSKT